MSLSITETPVLEDIAGAALSPALLSMSMGSQMNTEVIGIDPVMSSFVDEPTLSNMLDQKEQMWAAENPRRNGRLTIRPD